MYSFFFFCVSNRTWIVITDQFTQLSLVYFYSSDNDKNILVFDYAPSKQFEEQNELLKS